MKLIDFHTHLLPGLDDGAQNTDISLAMLADAAQQGVELIAATPHYYGNRRSVEEFVKERNEAALKLAEAISAYEEIPQIKLGAEVYLTRGLYERDGLKELCFEGTETMLVELPYGEWGSWVYREIEKLVFSKGLTIMLAHPERYVHMPWDVKKIKPFFQMDVLLQINADSVLERRRITKKLIESGCSCVLGSDAHDISSRKSRISAAAEVIAETYGVSVLSAMSDITNELGF